jgi:hypothetical protein
MNSKEHELKYFQDINYVETEYLRNLIRCQFPRKWRGICQFVRVLFPLSVY